MIPTTWISVTSVTSAATTANNIRWQGTRSSSLGSITNPILVNSWQPITTVQGPTMQGPHLQRGDGQLPHEDVIVMRDGMQITIKSDGLGARIILPNGAEIKVDANGDISLDEQNAKIHYRAAPRNFNKFLNTSDVVEEFIRYLGSLDVRQRHVLTLPLGLFINWLVIAAAEADGDPADDLRPELSNGISALKARPRCRYCARFIPRAYHDNGVNFCAPAHMERFLAREKLTLAKPALRLLPPSATYFERAA